MEQIVILRSNGTKIPIASKRTATSIKSMTQNVTLLGDDTVNIVVSSPFKQNYLIGDAIIVYGNIYHLNRMPKVKKDGMFNFLYELEFEGAQYDMMRATFDLTIDTTNNQLADISAESLTGSLKRFASVLLANLNRIFPGKWIIGDCPDTSDDKTLTFSEGDNCLSVAQNLCKEFETEFCIAYNVESGVYTLHFRKVGKTFPYKFEFGKNKGLYQLSRENVSTANIVTRLKVYGSTENITSKYRAQRLCLPGKSKKDSYIEKPEAVAKYGIWEGKKYFDSIKPSRTGKVCSVSSDSVLKFTDTEMFDLNAKDGSGNTKYLLVGTAAKIHFNTGNLSGYEFEVHAYDHATHTFTLVKQTDERGNVFPSESSKAFQFAVGDEYKLVDIALPENYETEAENELAEQGNIYYDQNSQPKVQYGLSVTESFLGSLYSNDTNGNVIWVGDYIPVKDSDIEVDKNVRVKSFKRDLMKDFSYTLTISDIAITASTTTRVISDLIDHDKAIKMNDLRNPARARANWRSSREVMNMVFDPDGDYYSDKIKPQSIDTMALSVGAKSMQFGLTNTVFQPNYGGIANRIVYDGGVLTHYTIKEDSAVSWILADGDVTLNDSSKAYYIYAKCSRNDKSGSIIFSTEQIKTDSDGAFWHFFIGVLNSVDSETKVRSLALTYGFTMINGRFIKTGRVESADGETYFDLDNSEIGGHIVFTQNGQKKTLEEVANETYENKNFINNTLPGLLDNIQEQLDGQIEQFFYDVDPSPLSTKPNEQGNVPNSEWSDEEKENHLGDMYYNTNSGKVWRYVKIRWSPKLGYAQGLFYCWQELQDSELSQAIAVANEALELGKTKNRVFTATPIPPYSVGDLWVQGASGDIMRCKVSRDSGNYSSSDWEAASKYTDNSALNTFINETYSSNVQSLTKQIDGKIEAWFQTTDPSEKWSDTSEAQAHVGDMWYNSSTKELKTYQQKTVTLPNGSLRRLWGWVLVEDKKAQDAYDAASIAKDTADGKRRVFVAQPYPPYDVGDLWVDGKELRRCVTSRESGTYQVNDWVVAVYYDNTKTTIDGGIVTSGTIQVAGDEKSILAGITGVGTTSDSIRFWAGSSFENRANAPFRVLQDGTVYMTKANVTGVVNANTGSIGGFQIKQGQIGYGDGSFEDKTYGLSLLNSSIKFRNSNAHTMFGVFSAKGLDTCGFMSLKTDLGTTLEISCECETPSLEYFYKPKALSVFGDQRNIGKVATYEKGYIGRAYTDIMEMWFAQTHKFHFTYSTTKNFKVNLPSKTEVESVIGNITAMFDIEIVCDRAMPNSIDIIPNGCVLYNNNGGVMSSFTMAMGDSLTLRYYNGGYMFVNNQN